MPKLVYSKDQIEQSCKQIGEKLTSEIKDDRRMPVVIGTMKGALNFMMDLIKHIKCKCLTDYIQISSYSGNKTTGTVILKKDITIDIRDRTVILVEDVIDTGISMNYLLDYIKHKHSPRRIIVVCLFDKKCARKVEVQIDYAAKVLEKNEFLYGYGLDFYEVGRNIPEVYTLAPEEIVDLLSEIEKD